jgi:hypothetical protein
LGVVGGGGDDDDDDDGLVAIDRGACTGYRPKRAGRAADQDKRKSE